jgi:hypothetical protein
MQAIRQESLGKIASVPLRQLQHALTDFLNTIEDCRRLAGDAYRWSQRDSRPQIPRKRAESMVALAFLRAYLAFEAFLEEGFVLYVVGMKPPRGRAPVRFTFPPTRREAKKWVIPEGHAYAKWDATTVANRALRFFRGGGPFTRALRGSQNVLGEAKTIRNAVAHESENAREKFETLARMKLHSLPSNLTVGGFLNTAVPSSTPPQSFLEFYLERLELVAARIVPG